MAALLAAATTTAAALPQGFEGTPDKVQYGQPLKIQFTPVNGPFVGVTATIEPPVAGVDPEKIQPFTVDANGTNTASWVPPMTWPKVKLTSGGVSLVVKQEGHRIDRFAGTARRAQRGKGIDVVFERPEDQANTRGEASVRARIRTQPTADPDLAPIEIAASKTGVFRRAGWEPPANATQVTLEHRDSEPHVVTIEGNLSDLFARTADTQARGQELAVHFDGVPGANSPPVADDPPIKVGVEFGVAGKKQNRDLELRRDTEHPDPPTYSGTQLVPFDWEYLRLVHRDSASHMVALLDADQHASDYADKYFLLHSGVVSLSPYRVVTTRGSSASLNTHRLSSSDSLNTAGYVEALFRHRKAWLTEEQEFPALRARSWWKPDDLELRIGTTFAGSDATASAVAGSGDVYGEVSMGWGIPTARQGRIGNEGAYALNLEFLGGFNTDRNTETVHGMMMFGPNLVVGIPFSVLSTSPTPRLVEMQLGAFFGDSDFPDMKEGGEVDEIENGRGVPRYHLRHAMALRADLRLPIGETGYLVLTSRTFDRLERDDDLVPWSLMIGVTIPIKSIGTAILGTGAGK